MNCLIGKEREYNVRRSMVLPSETPKTESEQEDTHVLSHAAYWYIVDLSSIGYSTILQETHEAPALLPRWRSKMTEDRSVPGTVHLVDLEGLLRAKHASGDQKDIVLIPVPSDDPDDPLNWSSRRKALSTACVSV